MVKLVKICGVKTVEAAREAIDAGADMVGMIMVPKRARTVDVQIALEITELIRNKRRVKNAQFQSIREIILHLNGKSTDFIDYVSQLTNLILENGPFSVGVFRNQDPTSVFALANEVNLDCIQLHGSEHIFDFLDSNDGKYLINKRYVIPKDIPLMKSNFEQYNVPGFGIPLLDSEAGGEGVLIDWSLINELTFGKFILAGGLTPENLPETKTLKNLLGFDVSGGVETDGAKDLKKVRQFVKAGKLL